ncbi:MAG TPA: hypothetical protein PK718_06430 [Candidatus Methanofastidiosa archaeon]|nr:hypothetical protein [Candidatus Methanofastidiosa archaeon]
METKMTLSLQTDSDGFITQECPECRRKFKIQYTEPKKGEMLKSLSYCPYCGYNGKDCFWTREQVEYIEKMTMNRIVGPMLDRFGRQLEHMSNSFMKIETSTRYQKHAIAPKEIEGLRKFNFKCCIEPIKILENWDSNLYCIICGKRVEFNGWK